MPGPSRRVRAMSDEPPPAGALRLARVAGVPVYLDRTWLLLGAFVAWTGWQSGQRPRRRHRHGASRSRSGWSSASSSPCSATRSPTPSPPGCSGFRVHRIVATLWGGHTAYDGTGTTPGRAAVVAVAGPLANLALAALGGGGTTMLPWPASEFAWSVHVAQPAARGVQPAARPPARRWSARAVAGLGAHRSPRPRARRGRLVRARPRRRRGAVAGACARSPEGTPTSFGVGLVLVMGWILWSGATAALKRAPLERLLCGSARMDDVDPSRVVVLAPLTPLAQARWSARPARGGVDERGLPTLLLPEPSETARDIATLPPATPRLGGRHGCPTRASSSSHRATDVEPVLRRDGDDARRGRGAHPPGHGRGGWSPPSGSTRRRRPATARN